MMGKPSLFVVKGRQSVDYVRALEYFLSRIPSSREPLADDPEGRAQFLIRKAASKAAVVSGGLALPPGPLAWVTVVPDVVAIWRVQAQLVADMASCYGKWKDLTPEFLLVCLVKAIALDILRERGRGTGDPFLISRSSLALTEEVLCQVGVRMAERLASRMLVRSVPLLGPGLMAGYAFYDTHQVGQTSLRLLREKERISIGFYDVVQGEDEGTAE